MRWVLLLCFLFTVIPSIHSQVVCYSCYGNSDTDGKFCNIDNLCHGPSCYFKVEDSGKWETGCLSEKGDANDSSLACSYENSNTDCQCLGDFCNQLTTSLAYLSTYWQSVVPKKTISPFLPSDSAVPCFECGKVQLNDSLIDLPCDKQHICQGGYCMTVRGEFPHSFCATSWEGSSQVSCMKLPNKNEQCVCAGQMCNFPYDPQMMPTTQPPPTQSTNAVPTGRPPVGNTTAKKCKDLRFNPNQQAVFMGNKLKDIIMNGFGGSSNPGLQNFQTGIDEHICGYSDDEEDVTTKKP